MTQQPMYEILLRSKGVEVSFDTTDPVFATAQLHQWVQHLFGIELRGVSVPITTQKVPVDTSPEAQISNVLSQMRSSANGIEENTDSIEQVVQSETIPVENVVEKPASDPEKRFSVKANTPLSTEDLTPVDNFSSQGNDQAEDFQDDVFEEKLSDTDNPYPEDTFDSFVDTLLSSVDEEAPVGVVESTQVSLPFEKVLTQASTELEASAEVEKESSYQAMTAVMDPPVVPDMANLTHPRLDQIEVESLKELFSYAPKASMGEDYLLLSAYFLDRFRGQPAASLREINAELLRSGLTPINHALIEVAVSKGLMELLPDTTGNAFATEYRLTSEGIEMLQGLLS